MATHGAARSAEARLSARMSGESILVVTAAPGCIWDIRRQQDPISVRDRTLRRFATSAFWHASSHGRPALPWAGWPAAAHDFWGRHNKSPRASDAGWVSRQVAADPRACHVSPSIAGHVTQPTTRARPTKWFGLEQNVSQGQHMRWMGAQGRLPWVEAVTFPNGLPIP